MDKPQDLPWGDPRRMQAVVSAAIASHLKMVAGTITIKEFLSYGGQAKLAERIVEEMQAAGVDLERL